MNKSPENKNTSEQRKSSPWDINLFDREISAKRAELVLAPAAKNKTADPAQVSTNAREAAPVQKAHNITPKQRSSWDYNPFLDYYDKTNAAREKNAEPEPTPSAKTSASAKPASKNSSRAQKPKISADRIGAVVATAYREIDQQRAADSANAPTEKIPTEKIFTPAETPPTDREKFPADAQNKTAKTAANQKNTERAPKLANPLAGNLPRSVEKENKEKKRHWLRNAIAALMIAGTLGSGVSMASSVWHDIRSESAGTQFQFTPGHNQDFSQDSQEKKAAPAAPELKQWPNIPSSDLNKLATGQQAGAITMPNGHVVKMLIGNKNQSNNDTNLMSPDAATVANLGDMSALGQPGVNLVQDHSGYLDKNVAFNQLADGESMLGKKFEVTTNDGTRLIYKVTQRVVIAPQFQGRGPTVVQTSPDGTPTLDNPNDPNSVTPVEGAKFFNADTGKFYADPLHPSDKEEDNNQSILALSTCAEDEMSKAYKFGSGDDHGLRIVTYLTLEQAVYSEPGNRTTTAGDGKSPITGYTPQQIQDMEALDSAAKTADGAMNQ